MLAAIYNIVWGTVIALRPDLMLFGADPSNYNIILIQCIAMLVGAYGLAYWYASSDPQRYWPLVFVGLIGKILGPIGALYSIYSGLLPVNFLWINFGNDFIWLVPFIWVLLGVYNKSFLAPLPSDKSLYQSVLGEHFGKLGSNLQKIHGSREPILLKGHLQVLRGKTLITQTLGMLGNLPKANQKAEVELTIMPSKKSELWIRKIEGVEVKSTQWKSNNKLIEQFGPITIELNLIETNGRIQFEGDSCSFFSIPFPFFFTPYVKAWAEDFQEGIKLEVEVSFRPFGRVLLYKGKVYKN